MKRLPRAATTLALLLTPVWAAAQELEPGAYWPIPAGLNIVTVVNSFNSGDLAFDPSAPIDNASARINTTSFAFTRAFRLAGRSANVGLALPVIGWAGDDHFQGGGSSPSSLSRTHLWSTIAFA